MIKVKTFAVNPFREATYVISDQSGEAIIIDCGVQTQTEIERVEDYLERNNLSLKIAVNTHCHIDHILGISWVKERYGVNFMASKKDEQLLSSADMSAKMYGILPPMEFVRHIDIDLDTMTEVKFGESSLQIIPTPGHTQGGVCLYDKESRTLFTGDTLFKGSIGRTDLPGGSYPELMESILHNLLPLGSDSATAGEITIYPGHGDHSTLSDEMLNNPFITDVINGAVNYK